MKTADKRETDEVFTNLDENGDNQISFEEFKSYLINYEWEKRQIFPIFYNILLLFYKLNATF